MTDPNVLLANEAGGGRGHVTLLADVARALGPGFSVTAAIPSLRFAGELAGVCGDIVRGPGLRYPNEALTDRALVGNATWGDYLAACGLAREDDVRAHLRWWRSKIIDVDASLLIADTAPLALWAARGLKAEGWDIEILSVGTGYGLPPSRLSRFPILLPDYARSVQREEETLSVLNRVGAEQGLAPLPALPAVAAADQEMAFTLPFLDPYAASRAAGESFVPRLSPLAPVAVGGGAEVFVYFSRTELADPALVEALADLPIPRRGFLPGTPQQTLDRLRAAGMMIEAAPLSMAAIAARSRLVLGAGQHGLQCLAALAGLPQVAIPQHLEQLFHSRRSEARGILRLVPFDRRTKDDITSTVLAAWSDPAFAGTARDSAHAVRSDYPADPAAHLTARLAPLAERARSAYR